MALILTPRQLVNRSELYRQLAQLNAAGMPIISSLEMLRKNPPDRSYRNALAQVLVHIKGGESFAGALERLGLWTPSFDIALIRAGEHSGRLDSVFRLLADYYTDRARLLRQIIADLLYPAFLLHFAVFLFPFIKWFAGGSWHVFLWSTFGVLIPLYGLVLAVAWAAQGRRGASWRSFFEQAVRPIPVLGTARHYLALSRVSAALEALLNAGVTIIEAWRMAAAASGSPALLRAVTAWTPKVVDGMTPSEAVSRSSEFPEMFRNLYHSGEISGQLDDSLRRLHTYYREEGTRKLHLLAQWFPRCIYLGVAVMIAFRVIGFYTNYFNQVKDAGGF